MAEHSPTADPGEATLMGEPRKGEAPPSQRGAPRTCYVVHDRGSSEMRFSRESAAELLAGGGFFWLDLDRPDADDFEILREVFRFHPLAVEDSEHFDQRAKIDDYDDFVFIVVYGAKIRWYCSVVRSFIQLPHFVLARKRRKHVDVNSRRRMPHMVGTSPIA
jgi:Mg2+ and Co2+ transporter CorA